MNPPWVAVAAMAATAMAGLTLAGCAAGQPPAWAVPTTQGYLAEGVLARLVSDALREPFGNVPPIGHSAAVDMEGPILAAEIVAFFLQQGRHAG